METLQFPACEMIIAKVKSSLDTFLDKCCTMIAKHPMLVLHLLIIFGLLLRFIRLWIEDFQPRDSAFYLENAQFIIDRGWLEFYKTGIEAFKNMPPGFFLILQTGHAMGLPMPVTGYVVLVFSYFLLMYSVYFGMVALWDDCRYALLGVFFAATVPWLLRLGVFIIRDAPYFSCGAAALAAGAFAVTREQYRYWLLFSVFSFCAIMLRKEGFELLMVMGIWSVASTIVQLVRRRWRSALFSAASGIMVMVLTLFPLLIIERIFRTRYGSSWEVIPTTWAGYIWSMFKLLLRS